MFPTMFKSRNTIFMPIKTNVAIVDAFAGGLDMSPLDIE